MTILVVGDGPVGLSTADTLANAGRQVVLAIPEAPTTDHTDDMPRTWRAAAAFWTPFSSGVGPQLQAEYCRRSLDYYSDLSSQERRDAGVCFRPVAEYWVKGEAEPYPWREFPGLETSQASPSDPYEYAESLDVHYRCEYRYRAPVIDVQQFRRWNIERLKRHSKVEVVTFKHPFEGGDLGTWSPGAATEWAEILRDADADRAVFCLGVSTVYRELSDEGALNPDIITFRKGVVAKVRAEVMPDDQVVLFEGRVFDADPLYCIPNTHGFVLGATITPAGHSFDPRDWRANDEEINAIRSRAEQLLPQGDQKQRLMSALENTDRVEWTTGVRPMLQGRGPVWSESRKLSTAIAELSGSGSRAYVHFGHGGSGYSFSRETAHRLAELLGVVE